MVYELPKLEYEYNSLEPFIDERTMQIHHQKHHKGYVDKLNKALEENNELQDMSINQLIKDLNKIPENIRTAVRNNGGGHLNHSFFWKLLSKDSIPEGKAIEAIKNKFGSIERFQEEFKKAAMSRFGSGWVWLIHDDLKIISTPNQDNPISDGKTPIIGLDLWEHAYYLKYQNKRDEYIDAFFRIINWKQVDKNFEN